MRDEILVTELQKLKIKEGDLLIIKIGSTNPQSPYHHLTLNRFKNRQRFFDKVLKEIDPEGKMPYIVVPHDTSFEKVSLVNGKFVADNNE